MAGEEEDNLESSLDGPLSMSFMDIGKDGEKLARSQLTNCNS